ncbi:MAG: hypothetical protein LUE17_11165, partial [Planctomycetaceae bacterium]|nr:hypothetical protein [Planctomycetaceae bacterium]
MPFVLEGHLLHALGDMVDIVALEVEGEVLGQLPARHPFGKTEVIGDFKRLEQLPARSQLLHQGRLQPEPAKIQG